MKNQNSLETKQRILKAAIQEFVERGYDGAHMQRIAEKSDSNKAVIYYYFKSKENLYEEVLSSIFQQSFKNVETALNRKMDFKETLICLIENYITFLEQNPSLVKIMMWENASGGEHIKNVLQNHTDYNIPSKLIDLLEEVINRGELREVDAIQTILSVIGMCVFYFIARPTIQVVWKIATESEAEFVEQRKKSIVDLILNGLRPAENKNYMED